MERKETQQFDQPYCHTRMDDQWIWSSDHQQSSTTLGHDSVSNGPAILGLSQTKK